MLNSIQNKILLAQVSVILLTAVTLGLISYHAMIGSLRDVQQDRMILKAKYESGSLDLFFSDTIDIMQRLSRGRAVDIYSLYYEESALIEYFLKFEQIFPILVLTDQNGQQQVKVVNGSPATDLNFSASKAVFQKAMKYPNQVVFSEVMQVPELEEPVLIFAVAKYNYFDEFSGVIMGAVPLPIITANIFTADDPGDSEYAYYLIDENRLILTAPEKKPRMSPLDLTESGGEEFIKKALTLPSYFDRMPLMETDSFVAGAALKYPHWAVLVSLPYADFIAPLNRLRDTVVAMTCFIILTASLIALALARNLTRPLIRLVGITESVARGNLSERLRVTSSDELGRLGNHFNRMIDDLDASRSEIIDAKDHLQNIISSMMDALIVTGPGFNVRMVNASTCTLLGYTEKHLLGTPAAKIFNMTQHDFETLVSRSGMANLEKTVFTRSGTPVDVLVSGSVIQNKSGRMMGLVCTARDITERKQLEIQIRESEHKYRSLLERANDSIIILQNTMIQYANPQVKALLDYEVNELTGRSIDMIMPSKKRVALLTIYSNSMLNGRAIPIHETTLTDKSNRPVPVEINTGMINFRNRPAFLLIIRDITERIQLNKERLRADKLESIGILAGGIAHDYNNILTGILGNLTLARLYISDHDRALEKIDFCEQAVNRAGELTDRLRTFSKGGRPRKHRVHIAPLIRDLMESLTRDTPVTPRIRIADDLLQTEVDPKQISRALKNLILNSVEAMPAGGDLKITAVNITDAASGHIPDGFRNALKISICDQGKGIPEHHMNKIYDPYFSTKQRGTQKGMGMGLAIVHSIITRHGGSIQVSSEPGKVTCFDLYLPAVDEGSDEQAVRSRQ